VRIWDLATGTPIGRPLTSHTSAVTAVATAILPEGRPIAITGSLDNTVRIWDLATGTPIRGARSLEEILVGYACELW